MEVPIGISASQGAMRSLPMKLESLLSGLGDRLQAEEKKKLRMLQGDLQGLIDNYLLEPSEVESPASTASSWMEGVRELSYDIDDFIYELTHVARGGARINVVLKRSRFKISRFPGNVRRRQWITDEISTFRTRVQEAIRRHTDYLGSNCKWRPSSSGQPPPPSLRSGEAATHLVGVDSSIKQLRGWLENDGQPQHKVASIVGPGGYGKTTLAKQVYRMLGGQFDCLAFVRTSPKADMKGLLTSILSQVGRHRLPADHACNVHHLVLNINAHLQDKTYLIVIEDLWALSTWDLINRSLPKGNRCSRILTTTQVEVIAQACCADNSKSIPTTKKEDDSRYIIRKTTLTEYESRELFLSTAFGKQAECPQHLKEVSNEIITASGGLPLAIIILASILARQPANSIEQWHYIRNSLGPALITSSSLERINQVLNLGYGSLPHCLKACMLYLCLYEEGCVIWKDDLVKQWIAEGFIGAVEGHKAEEVARSYFGELVNRGMIQPVDINCNDEILSCTVHYMVLHFVRDKSMEENFCIAVDHSQTTIKLADKVRRLALHFSNVEDATPPGPECMRLSKLRSMVFSGFPKCMPSIVDFRFLQVLTLKLLVEPDKMSDNLTASDDLCVNITEPDDLSDNRSECDGDLRYNLTEISELFRLRYFHLDACNMSVLLPVQIRQLKYLVAWEIYAEVTAVPSDIVDLPGLLYLSIPSEAHLPTGIDRMTSLRTLGLFNLNKNSSETIMGLSKLTNLQELRLTCDTLQPGNLEKNLDCLGVIVRKLRNLKRVTLVPAASSLVNTQNDGGSSSMSISWPGFSIQPLSPALLQTLELSRHCCIFSTLPEWTKELTNLCILKIAVKRLSRKSIDILKGLPSLAALSLFLWTAYTAPARIMFDDEGFSVLNYFKFVCATPCLEFLDGAMPNVRKLKLGFNANRLEQYSLGDTGFDRLTGLTEISTKIGGTGTANEHDIRSAALSILTTVVAKHPSNPIINVQRVDWNFCGDEEMGMDEEHAIQKKNWEKDAQKEVYIRYRAKKEVDTRTYTPPESTLHPGNTGIQSQIMCSRCSTCLLYRKGAPAVLCAVCKAVSYPKGMETDHDHLICGGCQTLLMYIRNATAVRCSCCDTVNLARPKP